MGHVRVVFDTHLKTFSLFVLAQVVSWRVQITLILPGQQIIHFAECKHLLICYI